MQNRNHFSSVSRPRDPNYLPLYSWSHFLSVGYCVISDPERPHSESHYSANLAPDVMRDSNYTKKPQLFAPSHCQEMVRSRQNFWQNSQKLQQNCWVSPSHSWVGQGWRGWWWCMARGAGDNCGATNKYWAFRPPSVSFINSDAAKNRLITMGPHCVIHNFSLLWLFLDFHPVKFHCCNI